MSLAKQGDKVKVHYTAKLEDGTVFESSVEREPMEITIGQRQVIPEFEDALVGMNPGEAKDVRITAENAYGPHRKEMIVDVSREKLPNDVEPTLGQQVQMQLPDGQSLNARIVDVSESAITLDANHPLAGQNLNFHLQLVEIA